jgi:hypothetical protein
MVEEEDDEGQDNFEADSTDNSLYGDDDDQEPFC